MALTAKQKAINEKQREQALKNKAANVKRNAAESKKTITQSPASKVSAVSSGFGGLVGKAAAALKKNRVKDVD